MLGWNTIERIVKVIGLKLDGLGDVVVAGNIVPGLFPFIAPGEDLGGEIRAKPASGNSVLDLESGTQHIALLSDLGSPSMLVALPDRHFQSPLFQGGRQIGHSLVGQEGWLPDEVVGDIGLKPREQLDSQCGTGVPALQTAVLVIVVFKIKSGEKGTLPEIVVDFEELPAAESVVLALLRFRRDGSQEKRGDSYQIIQNPGLQNVLKLSYPGMAPAGSRHSKLQSDAGP